MRLGRSSIRDSSEHALVDSEEKIWDPPTTHGRRGQSVTEPDVGQISHEFSSGMRKRQRVSPEKPLKGRDTGGHHRQPDE